MRRFFYRIVNTTLEEGEEREGEEGRIAYTGWYLVSTVDIVLNISREGRGGWSPENNVVIRHAISNRIRRPGNFFAYSQRENCFAYISYVHMRLITSFFFSKFFKFRRKGKSISFTRSTKFTEFIKSIGYR